MYVGWLVVVEEGLFGGWIVKIEDVTGLARRIGELVAEGKVAEARELLPQETVYTFLDEEARITCGVYSTEMTVTENLSS